MMNRFKLTGTTRELASLLQAARQEAIKLNAPAHVNYDADVEQLHRLRRPRPRPDAQSAADRILAASVTPFRSKVEFWGPSDGARERRECDRRLGRRSHRAPRTDLRSGRLRGPCRRLPAEGQQRQLPRGPHRDPGHRQDGAAQVLPGRDRLLHERREGQDPSTTTVGLRAPLHRASLKPCRRRSVPTRRSAASPSAPGRRPRSRQSDPRAVLDREHAPGPQERAEQPARNPASGTHE